MGEYVYTADGERLLRTEGGSTTLYLSGGQEVTLAGSALTAKRYYSFEGSTVAVRSAGGATGFTTIVADHHGTGAVQVGQANNSMVRRYTTPFGQARGSQVSWTGDRGFLDKPADVTGLVAVGARYYDPGLGRFVSVDPVMDLGDPQQWAAYSYGNNNPVTWADPTGELPIGAGHSGYNPQTDKSGGDPCAKASSCVKTVREERTGKTVRVRHNYTERAVRFFSDPKNSYADINVDRTYKGHGERAAAKARGDEKRQAKAEAERTANQSWWDRNGSTVLETARIGLTVAAVFGCAVCGVATLAWTAYDVAAADNLGEAAIAATGFIPAGGGASVRLARSALESRRLALRRAGMYNESRRFERHRNNMRDLDPIGNVMDEGALLISTHAYGGNMVDRFTSEASP